MKLNSSVKYYVSRLKPAVIIFYIVLAILSLVSVMLNFFLEDSTSSFGGYAVSSIIFLFVCGICSFTEEFKMFIQNGITRNALWKSFLYASIIVAAIMSAIDLIALSIMSLIIETESLTLMLSSAYAESLAVKIVIAYFVQIVFYVLSLSLGLFVRMIYYRMNKLGKTIISIAVPGYYLIALPIIMGRLNWRPILFRIFDTIIPLMNPNHFYGLPMLFILSIAFLIILTYINKLLISKAIIK